ncbi:MAG TPA: PucR family transcriptional regulator ligand-binding domain-containing protein [Kineosporiaceae bacterium]|nr:PucR family transcriptional regulator ligand-binding domain-containing protein [Kineosporiaceae bacterium]
MARSALTVEELVRSPALQLVVVAGAAGLDRPVGWAHVSELEDPTPWLLGHELLMTTGIAVPRSAARQRAYLERLDDAGVAALALSEQLHVPPLQPGFLAAADERGLPVLRVPLWVPFIAIAQEVAAAVQSDMHRRLSAQLHVFGALRTLAAEDLGVAELFARLERLSGYRLHLSTGSGRRLLPGVPAPPPELAPLLPASFDAPPIVPGGYVLPVPAPGGPAGFLLALERPGVAAAGLAVAQHIATIAALQVAIHRHERETQRREGTETLGELLQGVLDPPAARRRLARLGFAAGDELRLAVIRHTQAGAAVDDVRVQRDLDDAEGPALVLRRGREVHVLLGAGDDLAVLLGHRSGLAVGVSRPVRVGESLGAARREAGWAVRRALAQPDGGVVRFGEEAGGWWLPEQPQRVTALVEEVLGAVLTYDAEHGGQLVPSVRAWLSHDRRTGDAAAALHVHPNTLAYRIRRFEELSGRSLSSTAGLAEVWLALQAVEDSA